MNAAWPLCCINIILSHFPLTCFQNKSDIGDIPSKIQSHLNMLSTKKTYRDGSKYYVTVNIEVFVYHLYKEPSERDKMKRNNMLALPGLFNIF